MTGRDTDADVPGGECDTRLDARQQMQPADVTEERCEICPPNWPHTLPNHGCPLHLVRPVMVSPRHEDGFGVFL